MVGALFFLDMPSWMALLPSNLNPESADSVPSPGTGAYEVFPRPFCIVMVSISFDAAYTVDCFDFRVKPRQVSFGMSLPAKPAPW